MNEKLFDKLIKIIFGILASTLTFAGIIFAWSNDMDFTLNRSLMFASGILILILLVWIVILLFERISRSREFSLFDNLYLQQLQKRYSAYVNTGLGKPVLFTLPIEKMFIDLNFLPLNGKNDPLLSGLIAFINSASRKAAKTLWSIITEDTTKHHYVIIGGPGSGKSTLLRYLAYMLSSKNREFRKKIPGVVRIPVFINIKNCWKTIAENPQLPVEKLLESDFRLWKIYPKDNWLSDHIKNGHLLIMIDGLDEVPLANQSMVFEWVSKNLENWSKCLVIITTRPHGYENFHLPNVRPLFIVPFDEQQIKQFINMWYTETHRVKIPKGNPDDLTTVLQDADKLIKRVINDQRLWELAINPMLLAMITLIYWSGVVLPEKRVELYQTIIKVFIEEFRRAQGLQPSFSASKGQSVLQNLAFYMNENQILVIPEEKAIEIIKEPLEKVNLDYKPDVFLEKIEEESGILVKFDTALYGFTHRSLQDYLTAVYVKEKELESELLKKINNEWWYEIIRLYAAISDATNIIATCLTKAENIGVLILAVQCSEEAHILEKDMRTRLETFLYEDLEKRDPEKRMVIAEALIEIHFNPSQIGEKLISPFVTNAEYQLFSNEMKKRNYLCYPDHWTAEHYPNTQNGRDAIQGIRPSYALAFCDWLSHRVNTRWYYRLPNENEIHTDHPKHKFWVKRANETSGYPFTSSGDTERDRAVFPKKIIEIDDPNLKLNAQKILERNTLDMDLFLYVLRKRSSELSNDTTFCNSTFNGIKKYLSPKTAENLYNTLNPETLPRDNDEKQSLNIRISESLYAAIKEIFDNRLLNRYKLADLSEFLSKRIAGAIARGLEEKLRLDQEIASSIYDSHTSQQKRAEIDRLMDDYVFLYSSLVILAGRIHGRFPATEGFLVVIENKEKQ